MADIGYVDKRRDALNRSKQSEKGDELSLTLDTRLEPALDVPTQIRRRADAVFEKEQDLVAEDAGLSSTSSRGKHELYISENGSVQLLFAHCLLL